MVAALKHLALVANKASCATLGENGALQVSKMTKTLFPGVATSSKGLLREAGNLPVVHTSNGFDPNAYKLMEESGYDFSKSPSPGHVIDTKHYGPNDAQKMMQK